MGKEQGRKLVAQNRKARHDYHVEDTFEAGLVLTGTEVKNDEMWLQGVHIPQYTEGTWTNHEPRRARKLLLHRREIERIESRVNERGLTVVPLALYFKDGKAKVEIALARGKKAYDKRQAIAKREADREAAREMGRRAKGKV